MIAITIYLTSEPNMNSIEWECKRFSELSTNELFDLVKLRIEIFVVEQQCPYSELDDKDRHQHTRHLMGFNNSQLVCCARLLAPGISYAEVSIGRLAVAKPHRRNGLGSALMHQCINHIYNIWPHSDIRMSAQQYLSEFYTHLGFNQTSEVYLEDNIPHIQMLKTFATHEQ